AIESHYVDPDRERLDNLAKEGGIQRRHTALVVSFGNYEGNLDARWIWTRSVPRCFAQLDRWCFAFCRRPPGCNTNAELTTNIAETTWGFRMKLRLAAILLVAVFPSSWLYGQAPNPTSRVEGLKRNEGFLPFFWDEKK